MSEKDASGEDARRRVLVIKLGALGDFFLALAAMQAIRRHHPRDDVALLTIPSLTPLARLSGLFDAVLEDPRGRSLAAWAAMRRTLRAGRFDRVYDLQCQKRTNRYHWLFAPGPWPEWSGTARLASHPDRYPGRRRVPMPERLARQLRPFGIEPAAADLGWLDADAGRFGLAEPFALLVPGSSPHRPGKRWPAERFAAVGRALAAHGLRVALVGGPDEADAAKAIADAVPGCLDLIGRTSLPEVAGLARRAAVVVGNDTGPLHIAAAVGAPTVGLYSDASGLVQVTGPRMEALHRPLIGDLTVEEALAAAERALQPLQNGKP